MTAPARNHETKRRHNQPRPLFLSLLCIFSFIFYGILSILFLLSIFYSGRITHVINIYRPEGSGEIEMVPLIAIAGFVLHASAFAGSINIWYRRKTGYIIFSVATLIITVYQLAFDRISILTTSVYILLIILFGLYYKRFH